MIGVPVVSNGMTPNQQNGVPIASNFAKPGQQPITSLILQDEHLCYYSIWYVFIFAAETPDYKAASRLIKDVQTDYYLRVKYGIRQPALLTLDALQGEDPKSYHYVQLIQLAIWGVTRKLSSDAVYAPFDENFPRQLASDEVYNAIKDIFPHRANRRSINNALSKEAMFVCHDGYWTLDLERGFGVRQKSVDQFQHYWESGLGKTFSLPDKTSDDNLPRKSETDDVPEVSKPPTSDQLQPMPSLTLQGKDLDLYLGWLLYIFTTNTPNYNEAAYLIKDAQTDWYLRVKYGIRQPTPVTLDALENNNMKSYHYGDLIQLAIWGSPARRLTTSGVQTAIEQRFPEQQVNLGSMKNALSLKAMFVLRDGSWTLDIEQGEKNNKTEKGKDRSNGPSPDEIGHPSYRLITQSL